MITYNYDYINMFYKLPVYLLYTRLHVRTIHAEYNIRISPLTLPSLKDSVTPEGAVNKSVGRFVE